MITLKTLAQATPQQVFDQVVTHLRTQKVQAISSGSCVYRAGELKCAAGCLIADDEYNPIMDVPSGDNGTAHGTSWNSLIARGLAPNTEHNALIQELQSVHDAYDGSSRWEPRLKDVADYFDLTFNQL